MWQEDEGKNDFLKYELNWDKENNPWGYYQRVHPATMLEDLTNRKAKVMTVVDTDYYSYAVAHSCQEFGAFHYADWAVLSRDKEPPMFMRNKMRNTLLKHQVDIPSMKKGPLTTCWGQDIYN